MSDKIHKNYPSFKSTHITIIIIKIYRLELMPLYVLITNTNTCIDRCMFYNEFIMLTCFTYIADIHLCIKILYLMGV